MKGILIQCQEIKGSIKSQNELKGNLEVKRNLIGTLKTPTKQLQGSLKTGQTLRGKIVMPEIVTDSIEFLTNFEIEALIQGAL